MAEEELPLNWIENRDAATGRVYWKNVVTNETTFVRPEPPLPEDWHEVKLDDGRKYFFNVITRATTWKRPRVTDEEDEVSEKPLKPGWQETYTKEGRRYYYHTKTKEVSWVRPVVSEEEPVGPLPAGWKEVRLEDGRQYFYNTETKETTWDRPVAEDESKAAELPPHWVERRGTDGETFYFNQVTHKTLRERPTATDRVPIKTKRRERENIFTPSAATGSITLVKVPKSAAVKSTLTRSLQSSFLFSQLKASDLADLVDTMTQVNVSPGENIITQGEQGDIFYVVERGEFDVVVNDHGKVATRGAGDSFGEIALLYNCPRTATVRATTNSVVWALDRVTFRYMITRTEGAKMAAITNGLRAAKMLSSLSESQISRVAEVVQVLDYKAGDIIFRKGETGNFFFIVRTGAVTITDISAMGRAVPDVELTGGESFGERALLLSEPRAGTAIAKTATSCLVIGRKDFNEHLGSLGEVMHADLRKKILSSVNVLQPLSNAERKVAFPLVAVNTYSNAQVVLREGQMAKALYVVQEGTVEAVRGGRTVATFSIGDHWGDDALQLDLPAEATYKAQGAAIVMTLSRAHFEEKLGSFSAILKRGAVEEVEEKTAPTPPPKARGATIAADDLIEIGLLGSGSFGRVTLVKHAVTGKPYALKRLRKLQVVQTEQQKNVMGEKNAMMALRHPFILKLHATFQDRDCLFMVLELCLGGELFAYLARQPRHCVSPSDAQFYCACVVSAIDHMHSKDIVYRDMKPENMLIDDDGYVKVIDFGFAKVIKEKTYTLCGTPEYLAPELVMGSGHGKGVDYWAIGILTYEMIVGSSPFADHVHGDQMTICRNIVEKKLRMPKAVPSAAGSLIRALLNRTVALRLGCGKGGVSDIMNHKWFRRFDWVKLSQKRLRAPWKPKLKNPFDTSNFVPEDYAPEVDAYHGSQDWCVDF